MNNTKNNYRKYPKDGLQKIVQENSRCAKKYFVVGSLGFLCIHACAVNVNLELFENVYFSPWIVFKNRLNLHVKILHEPNSFTPMKDILPSGRGPMKSSLEYVMADTAPEWYFITRFFIRKSSFCLSLNFLNFSRNWV